MNLLALDLALHCGYACEIAGLCESGVVNFSLRKGERYGMQFARFHIWLYAWQAKKLDLVVYEKPIPFHLGQAASQLAFGFSSRVEEFCARYDIRCESVQATKLKAWATGSGRADKEAMVKAAQILKRGVTDHNECDALWILDWAKAHVAKENMVRRSA